MSKNKKKTQELKATPADQKAKQPETQTPKAQAEAPKQQPQTAKAQSPTTEPKTKIAQPKAPAQPAKSPVLSLSESELQKEIESLKELVAQHAQQIADLQSRPPARTRKPMKNGKVQIRDKKTGTVYPSKNGTYQSLLKSGELKELVDQGIFGPEPEKNNFGWFALVRAWPDRFEEVKADESKSKSKSKKS